MSGVELAGRMGDIVAETNAELIVIFSSIRLYETQYICNACLLSLGCTWIDSDVVRKEFNFFLGLMKLVLYTHIEMLGKFPS